MFAVEPYDEMQSTYLGTSFCRAGMASLGARRDRQSARRAFDWRTAHYLHAHGSRYSQLLDVLAILCTAL